MFSIPVLVYLQPALVGYLHPMPWHKFPYAFENGPVVHHPAAIRNATNIPFWLPAHRQECLRLGREENPTADNCPYQRLDAESITGGDDSSTTVSIVEQHKGELATQVLKKAWGAIDLVQRER